MASGGYAYSSFNFTTIKNNIENVECRVCDDVFSLQGERVPRLLHCGHTVCQQCLARLPLNDNIVLCPFDRQPTQLGECGVWSLKKNFALIELLERLQYSSTKCGIQWNEDSLAKEKELAVPCDESEQHTAVLYCVTCSTHLCLECSEATHSTRTLSRHRRVPLSEKPHEMPKCTYHPMHLVEFVCLEKECQSSPSHMLMCYICKDYGRHVKHKHALLETEAATVRNLTITTVNRMRTFVDEVTEWARKIGTAVQQMEGGMQVAQDSDGQQRTVQVAGTAEQSRQRVKSYFAELHEQLTRQEKASLVVIETHVRERLGVLKQQQEDLALLLSHVSAVCQQCEKTVQQDDTKVVLAKAELTSLLETIHKQQQQFAELPEQLQLDPNIPITFTKDNRVHIGPKMEMRVVTLGLDNSGKTSILFQLKQNEFIQAIPTIGFNVETVEYKNLKFTIWDVGGQHKLRPLWKHYYFNTQALVFVMDSSDRDRLSEAHDALTKLLQEKELKQASLLIFANKQDKPNCMTIEEMTEQLGLFKLCCNRSWHIQGCNACNGAGLLDGLEWLSYQLVAAGL